MGEKKSSVIAKIILGSVLGVFVFIIPISWKGEMTIPLWIIKGFFNQILGVGAVYILLGIVVIAALGSTYVACTPKKKYPGFIEGLFRVSPFMLIVRWLAVAAETIAIFQLGPEEFWEPNTGGLIALKKKRSPLAKPLTKHTIERKKLPDF